MPRMFGTDGVRGIANADLTCELAFSLGRAGAAVLASHVHRPTILVGRDTRISGMMLENALIAGICSTGAKAVQVGILPTPGIAYLTRYYEADAGVVISASHNTVEFNGIKFFDKDGHKLPDELEDEIEKLIRDKDYKWELPIGDQVGRPVVQQNAERKYVDFVKGTTQTSFGGLNIVLDCAQGASYRVAPMVFSEMGATVHTFYHEPDGTNINDNCGSTHPERLCELVRELGADVGLAFDGDADRLIAVDERGQIVNGDQVMLICALYMKKQGRLKKNTLVTTVMSNMGLDIALKENDIRSEKTKVGDRYVLENMLKNGYNLGGEQSGHVIFLDFNSTGDGLVSAVQLLTAMVESRQPLGKLAAQMDILPQALYGAHVEDDRKHIYEKDAEVQAAIAALEKKYAGAGRVLVRPSGTEPLVRVMIEGKDQRVIDNDVFELAKLIEKKSNA
ncbi:MAG: phosphoglucosamine mutase [Eubacteriales bacterium]|nr:phosphoglucosamine mutase [Eubacteriales bacterium]MDD3882649.1 phosphoglucosamine mutase [Eubacteriales bacterium]MDD4512779.1 phosphoglucosamine mutase [Eubacteriales bacterium]